MHFKVPRKPFTTIFQPYSQSFRRAQNILWNCLFKSEFGRFSRRKCRKTIFVKSWVSEPNHIFWKLLKMSHLNFSILAFSTNFCPIKNDLSRSFGNSKCKPSSLRSQCWMRLFCDFQTLWNTYDISMLLWGYKKEAARTRVELDFIISNAI